MTKHRSFARLLAAALLCLVGIGSAPAQVAGAPAAAAATDAATGLGPVRLRPATPELPGAGVVPMVVAPPPKPAKPGEFETFVQLQRFGAELVSELAELGGDANPTVPPDYVVQAGDEVQVTLWGSVDADLKLTVDRSGRITLPRVGPVQVAGLRYQDLTDAVSRRVSQVFKGYQISVGMGRLRGVRVFVTGYVERPGTFVVPALTTVTGALLRAGGPAAAGSFRQIQLKRAGRTHATIDLYDLLLRGERGLDQVLQPEDVIFVAPVGVQAAMTGSVNRSAIFELKEGETLGNLLTWAGGFSAVADRKRVLLERLDDRNGGRVQELAMPAAMATPIASGDIVRAVSVVGVSLPVQSQNKRVRVEGEVLRPGEYLLPPESSIQDAIRAAGGLTAQAYLFGADFSRESVRKVQQANYERALRDLETEVAKLGTSQRISNTEEAAAASAQATATSRLVERLRSVRPTGRIVLQLAADATDLPPLIVEDGDRLYIPPRPNTVGVFGSVFNGGSYLHAGGRTVGNYLQLAGGPTKGADTDSIFVVKASGTVVSARQDGSRWFGNSELGQMQVQPGDTIFVPEELNKTTFIQSAKDWTQILYQFGLGIAGLVSASR